MQLHYSVFLTPFLAGFVGYFTNYLAIKMLFRPHKKRWYSFGWQGVIPKNRSKLAKEIGKLVGNELLTEQDIIKSLKSDNFQFLLAEFVRREFRSLTLENNATIGELLGKINIPPEKALKRVLESLLFDGSEQKIKQIYIDKLATIILKHTQNITIDLQSLTAIIDKFTKDMLQKDTIKSHLKELIDSLLRSNQSISDITGYDASRFTNEFAHVITKKLQQMIPELFKDSDLKYTITNKIINFKNRHFGNSFFDHIKLGILNIFLNEDTISDLVNDELPKLIEDIVHDSKTFNSLHSNISINLKTLFITPISDLLKNLEWSKVESFKEIIAYSISQWIASDDFSALIRKVIIGDSIDKSSIPLTDIIPFKETDLKYLLEKSLAGDNGLKLLDFLSSTLGEIMSNVPIDKIFKNSSEETYELIINNIIDEVNKILDRNITHILDNIKLSDIVENKVNSLNLYQIEGLLFSFMADQFRWINILGFILGFLFGMIQSIFIIVYGG